MVIMTTQSVLKESAKAQNWKYSRFSAGICFRAVTNDWSEGSILSIWNYRLQRFELIPFRDRRVRARSVGFIARLPN